jgi:hypothetical protein
VGPVGPEGPTGIVISGYAQGMPALVDSPGIYLFLGPTISVNATATSHIHFTGTAVLGTTAVGGASMSRLSACHQLVPGGALVDHLNDWSSVAISVNTRIPMTVSQRIAALAAGTYNVGLCYQMAAGQAVNWNNNQWVNTRVLVTP